MAANHSQVDRVLSSAVNVDDGGSAQGWKPMLFWSFYSVALSQSEAHLVHDRNLCTNKSVVESFLSLMCALSLSLSLLTVTKPGKESSLQ